MSAIYTKSTLEKKVKKRIYSDFTFQFNSFLIDNALKNTDQLRILIVSDREISPVLLDHFIHSLERDKNLRIDDGLQHHLTRVNIEDFISKEYDEEWNHIKTYNNDYKNDMIYLYNINSMRRKSLFDKDFKDLDEQLIEDQINVDDYYQTAYLFEIDLSDLDFKNTEDKEFTLDIDDFK